MNKVKSELNIQCPAFGENGEMQKNFLWCRMYKRCKTVKAKLYESDNKVFENYRISGQHFRFKE